MREFRRILAVVSVTVVFLVIGGAAAIADPGDGVQHGGSLDAYKMTAHVFKAGGSHEASLAIQHHCYDVHVFIDEWYESQGVEWGFHYDWWVSRAQELREWMTANPDLVEEIETNAGVTSGFTNADIVWCTNTHEDGWKVATDSIVDLTDNDDEISFITVNGVTVTCSYGQVMMASATYYYNYYSGLRDGQSGAFSSGFGTNWVDLPGGSVLWSTDIEFRCLDIFDPGTDVAEVVDAVPTTQVNANPYLKGLTGLDTWLWYDFSNPAASQLGPYEATTVSAAGEDWTVTAFAWMDQVMWDVDCVSSCDYKGMAAGFDASGYEYVLDFEDSLNSPAPDYFGGIEADDQAAFEHIYEQIGDVTLSTAALWRGWYYVTSSDGDVGPRNYYDSVVVAEGYTFPVVSVRSELRTSPSP